MGRQYRKACAAKGACSPVGSQEASPDSAAPSLPVMAPIMQALPAEPCSADAPAERAGPDDAGQQALDTARITNSPVELHWEWTGRGST
jgi:hypothetical protein